MTGQENAAAGAWVDVNEAHLLLYSNLGTSSWWELYRLRFKDTDRITTTRAGFPGDRIRIACDDRAHAESLVDLIVSQGAPKAALKIGAAWDGSDAAAPQPDAGVSA